MRLKKIIAAFAAAALVCALSLNVSAEEGCKAVIGVADTLFSVQDFKTSVKITGDGRYILETKAAAGAEDIGVLTVTIEKLAKEHPDAAVKLNKIEIDGKNIPFKADNVRYGDLNKNGDYRIEVIDQYTDGSGDPAIDQATRITKSLKITFTVSGYERAVPVNAAVTLPETADDKQDKQGPQDTPNAQETQPAEETAAPDRTTPDEAANANAAANNAADKQDADTKPEPPKTESAEASAPIQASDIPISGNVSGVLSGIVIFGVIVVIAYKKKSKFLPFSLKKH